jgi:hypothetical protein
MAPMVSAAVIALAGAAVYTLMLSDDAMLKQPTAAIPDVRSASLAR